MAAVLISLHLLAALRYALFDAHQYDDAEIGVGSAVDEHGLERLVGVAVRGMALDDGFQHRLHIEAGLRETPTRLRRIDADHVFDLRLDPVLVGGRQVDLVEDCRISRLLSSA